MFVNNRVRTTNVKEVILKIALLTKDSGRNKKGQETFFELLPCEVKSTDRISKPNNADIDILMRVKNRLEAN